MMERIVKIIKLSIHNFRGIRDLSLDFSDTGSIIFIGVNGAGKTSILDGIAILMSWLAARLRSQYGVGLFPKDSDITIGSNVSQLEITFLINNEPATWNIRKTRKRYKKVVFSDLTGIKTITSSFEATTIPPDKMDMPVVVYYPVNRAVLDIPLRIRKKHTFDQLAAYENALTGGADFRTFFEWFRDQEDFENQQKARSTWGYEEDPQLKTVRKAIYYFLPDFRDLQVQRRPLLRMIISKGFEVFEINQLSDGEKCLLALVGDLARRLSLANPSLPNPLEGHGIILIDEIELHLHPQWQREVIPKLVTVFPNCQFIITTHSPQVLSEAREAAIFGFEWGMEGITAYKLGNVYGKDSNRILEDIMDTSARPEIIREKIRSYFELIDTKRMEEAQKVRKELEQEIGTDEPEFARADVLIRRREILGR
jgi:predicted ATP-binding protein involved in virulence